MYDFVLGIAGIYHFISLFRLLSHIFIIQDQFRKSVPPETLIYLDCFIFLCNCDMQIQNVPIWHIKKPCGGIFEPCLACLTEDCQQIGSVSLKCTAILLLPRVSTFVANEGKDFFSQFELRLMLP